MEMMEGTKQLAGMFKTWTDTQTTMWNEGLKALQGFGNSHSNQVWDKPIEAGKEKNMGTRTGNGLGEMLRDDHEKVKGLHTADFSERLWMIVGASIVGGLAVFGLRRWRKQL